MKKLLPMLLVLSLVLVVPAMAEQRYNDPPVKIDVDFNKFVSISEKISWNLDAKFKIDERFDPEEMAKAIAVKYDLNAYNYVESSNNKNEDKINKSFTDFNGIAQVNQASGSINNQGNVVAAAVVSGSKSALDAEAALQLNNDHNTLLSGSNNKPDGTSGYLDHNFFKGDVLTDSIDYSFNNFTGLAQVNQSAGYMNNQNNVVALAADKNGGIVALADSALSMSNTYNNAFISNAYFSNSINNSFQHFTGLAQVSQSAGSMNNQANVVAIAAGIASTR